LDRGTFGKPFGFEGESVVASVLGLLFGLLLGLLCLPERELARDPRPVVFGK